MEKYKTAVANIKKMKQKEVIIDSIIEDFDKKREVIINKNKKAQLKDEVSIYRLEENTLDYVHTLNTLTP